MVHAWIQCPATPAVLRSVLPSDLPVHRQQTIGMLLGIQRSAPLSSDSAETQFHLLHCDVFKRYWSWCMGNTKSLINKSSQNQWINWSAILCSCKNRTTLCQRLSCGSLSHRSIRWVWDGHWTGDVFCGRPAPPHVLAAKTFYARTNPCWLSIGNGKPEQLSSRRGLSCGRTGTNIHGTTCHSTTENHGKSEQSQDFCEIASICFNMVLSENRIPVG